MAAVMAHAERTGASVLAEGMETEAHLERALALGAVFGQGWHLDAPARLRFCRRPRPRSRSRRATTRRRVHHST